MPSTAPASASQRTGASLSLLQELGYAARLNGSSVEASTRSIESLSQKIGEAANGVGRGAMLFQKLGLQARQADGSVKSVGDMLGDVQEKSVACRHHSSSPSWPTWAWMPRCCKPCA